MTWLSPWAFFGLAAMALPILVHWLARHEADRRLFPTDRFLPATPPTSVRRHRLTDVALLALRCAIIAAAAAALAQPALRTPPATGGRPPRAVVVDTSASLLRTLAGADDGAMTGATAADAAVTAALADADADASVVVRDTDVRRALARAGAWLREQPGAGEVVVISDFQVGAVAEADFDALPASAGRRFVRMGVTGTVPAPAGAGTVRVYGAPAAEAAARAVVGDSSDGGRAAGAAGIVVAFEGAPEYAQLKADARPLDTPEAYALATHVAEMTSGVFFGSTGDPKKTPDVISALVVLSTAPPDSVEAATLIANALRAAAAPAVSLAEQEPDTIDAAVVGSWQREPRPDMAPRTGDPHPLGRWVWALVLVLLALETWIRRQRATPVAVSQEAPHARVA